MGNLLLDVYIRAAQLAEQAHEGQKRWEGDPYITHPFRVAKAVEKHGRLCQAVAMLHDVVEDTPITLEEIHAQFGKAIGDGVDSVTHRAGETYCDFILRSKADSLGCLVKIADITDNLKDIDKFPNQEERKEKYLLARWILQN